jgi:hypothetical protein
MVCFLDKFLHYLLTTIGNCSLYVYLSLPEIQPANHCEDAL